MKEKGKKREKTVRKHVLCQHSGKKTLKLGVERTARKNVLWQHSGKKTAIVRRERTSRTKNTFYASISARRHLNSSKEKGLQEQKTRFYGKKTRTSSELQE